MRLDYEFTDSEATSRALGALRVAASYQDAHRGVLVYHFSVPDPHSRPHRVEFVEVYANELTFWAHLSHPEIKEAASQAITPDSTLRSIIHAYGPGIQGRVKDLCMGSLSARQPETLAGYVLRDGARLGEVTDPIYLKFQIEVNADDQNDVSEALKKLHESTHDGVIVFHAASPYTEDGSEMIEINEICLTVGDAVKHLGSEKSQEALVDFFSMCKSVDCYIFGNVSSELQELLETTGIQIIRRETSEGYILHKDADIKCQD